MTLAAVTDRKPVTVTLGVSVTFTPAEIIESAAADGVKLSLSAAGTVKACGDNTAVNRWLPTIRKHKPGILAALRASVNASGMTAKDERAIRAWLANIEETDTNEIQSVLEECRADPGALTYFLGRAAEVPR